MSGKFVSVLLILCAGILLVADKVPAVNENGAASYKNTISVARETLWKAITSTQGSGATVAVMDQGKIVYSEGIGVANREENRPVDRNTRFNFGSVSKMFAAVAVLQLVDEGKLRLDDRVASFIPEFKMKDPRYKDITVRMLFNHSSGLPGGTFYVGGPTPGTYLHDTLFDTLKDEHLKYAPGDISVYCNDGFTLAEILVERISGEKYLDFLKKQIFTPLRLDRTAASIGEIGAKNVAEYYASKTGQKYPTEIIQLYGAGGLSSTADDMCRFGDSFCSNGKRILSKASLKEILKVQPDRFSRYLQNPGLLNAFGWDIAKVGKYQAMGMQVLGKSGGTGCFSSFLLVVPEKRISIALSISGHTDVSMKGAFKILDALMKDKHMVPQKVHTIKKPLAPQPVPEDLLKYAGYYIGTSPVRVKFTKNGFTACPIDEKTAQHNSKPLAFIYNRGYFHYADFTCYFTTIGEKRYIILHNVDPFGLDAIFFQKLDTSPKPVSLKHDINGKVWLLRNALPGIELHFKQGNPLLVVSNIYPELPGYVGFSGTIDRIESPDFAGMAATAIRDQDELTLFKKGGKLQAKWGYCLFSNADDIRKINSGVNKVRIGKKDYNEWLKVQTDTLLSFGRPEGGRIVVLTPQEGLYDSVLDSGEMYAPAGSYVFCAGKAGDQFKINAQ